MSKGIVVVTIGFFILFLTGAVLVEFRTLPSYIDVAFMLIAYGGIFGTYYILEARKRKEKPRLFEGAEESQIRYWFALNLRKMYHINIFGIEDGKKSEYINPIAFTSTAHLGEELYEVRTIIHDPNYFKGLPTMLSALIDRKGEFLWERIMNVEWGFDRTLEQTPEQKIWNVPRVRRPLTPEELIVKEKIEAGESIPLEIVKKTPEETKKA